MESGWAFWGVGPLISGDGYSRVLFGGADLLLSTDFATAAIGFWAIILLSAKAG